MTWTDEMRANLIELSKTKTDAEIAKIFGRSERTIRSMRASIGDTRPKAPSRVNEPKQPNTEFFDWADYNNEII